MSRPIKHFYEFGPFRLDAAERQLWRAGEVVSLTPKAFDLLQALVEGQGHLLEKEELMKAVWPDAFVEEANLSHNISQIRRILGDGENGQRYIETVPKRGYRFVGALPEPRQPLADGDKFDGLAQLMQLDEGVVEVGGSLGEKQLTEVPGRGLGGLTPGISCGAQRRPLHAVVGRRWSRSTWRYHIAWAAAAIVLTALASVFRPVAPGLAPPPNPRPVIVLMDSPLPGRVYDPSTEAAGGTNADDLTDALRDLPVVIQKENTSAVWHREEQVLGQNPDLIVSHLSCLLDERVGADQAPVAEHLFSLAANRLTLFFGYVATVNPRTRFLVYSRSRFRDPALAEQWVRDAEARLPALRGRLYPFSVPSKNGKATFRDAETARLIRERTQEILDLR